MASMLSALSIALGVDRADVAGPAVGDGQAARGGAKRTGANRLEGRGHPTQGDSRSKTSHTETLPAIYGVRLDLSDRPGVRWPASAWLRPPVRWPARRRQRADTPG